MKIFISLGVTLFIVLFLTNDLFSQRKDTLINKELGFEVFAGSRVNMNGIFFSSNLYFSRNKLQYDFQYNYYGFNYVKLDNINFHGYLGYAHILALLTGYKIPIRRFCILPMAGISIGKERYGKTVPYDNGYTYGMIGDNTAYTKRDFFGLAFTGALKYKITNNISTGLTFSTFLNNILNHPDEYYGLQLNIGYKIKDWTKYQPIDTAKNKGRWDIRIVEGIDYGKVAIKQNNSLAKKYNTDKTILANCTSLSFAKKYHSGIVLDFAFQGKRISFEHIYSPGGPLSKTTTSYDLLSFSINGGYYHDYKKISLYSCLGAGTTYLLAETETNIGRTGIPYSPGHYIFNQGWHKDNRLTIPVLFSFGIDYSLNKLLSFSIAYGMDYNLVPFSLLNYAGYSNYGYDTNTINQYSIYCSLGITFNIQKRRMTHDH